MIYSNRLARCLEMRNSMEKAMDIVIPLLAMESLEQAFDLVENSIH